MGIRTAVFSPFSFTRNCSCTLWDAMLKISLEIVLMSSWNMSFSQNPMRMRYFTTEGLSKPGTRRRKRRLWFHTAHVEIDAFALGIERDLGERSVVVAGRAVYVFDCEPDLREGDGCIEL